MSFEERFANVGRWLDDLVWSLKTRSGSGNRMRGMRDAVAERMRTAKEGAGEQLERVKYMHMPETDGPTGKGWRIAGVVVVCVLCMAVGIFVGPRVFGTTQHRLTVEEMAAMEKLRANANRTTLFTPAPQEGEAAGADGKPAARPRTTTANPMFEAPVGGAKDGGGRP
jgi:hypothetical protein